MEWLEWRIRTGSKGVNGIVEDGIRIFNTLGLKEDGEVGKVRVLWRIATLFQQAGRLVRQYCRDIFNNICRGFHTGFVERATALFQAQAELFVFSML
jgi:hypothetical protein